MRGVVRETVDEKGIEELIRICKHGLIKLTK